MVPDDLPYSKGRIDRAGRALRRHLTGDGPPLSRAELDTEIVVVEVFRSEHRDPLRKARMGLRSCVDTEGLQAVEFGQRLKRTPTIVDKLRRLPTMKLSSMQDIGGCRAVFATQAAVAHVLDRFTRNSFNRNGVEDTIRDYAANPRPSGYRGVHVWTRYDGRRIEVQLRTQLQHQWAKLVETLVVISGVDYKSGDGHEVVHDWLRRLSEGYAINEAGRPVSRVFRAEYDELQAAAWALLGSDAGQGGGIHG